MVWKTLQDLQKQAEPSTLVPPHPSPFLSLLHSLTKWTVIPRNCLSPFVWHFTQPQIHSSPFARPPPLPPTCYLSHIRFLRLSVFPGEPSERCLGFFPGNQYFLLTLPEPGKGPVTSRHRPDYDKWAKETSGSGPEKWLPETREAHLLPHHICSLHDVPRRQPVASGQNDGLLQGHTQGAPVDKSKGFVTMFTSNNALQDSWGCQWKVEQYASWEKYSFFPGHLSPMYSWGTHVNKLLFVFLLLICLYYRSLS